MRRKFDPFSGVYLWPSTQRSGCYYSHCWTYSPIEHRLMSRFAPMLSALLIILTTVYCRLFSLPLRLFPSSTAIYWRPVSSPLRLFPSSTAIYWRPVSSPLRHFPIFDRHILETGFIAAPPLPIFDRHILETGFIAAPPLPIFDRHILETGFIAAPPFSHHCHLLRAFFCSLLGREERSSAYKSISAGVGIESIFVKIVASRARPLCLLQTLVGAATEAPGSSVWDTSSSAVTIIARSTVVRGSFLPSS
jgi:hypothetical protein